MVQSARVGEIRRDNDADDRPTAEERVDLRLDWVFAGEILTAGHCEISETKVVWCM